MAKSKRNSVQPSRQQRRLQRQAVEARELLAGRPGAVVSVPAGMAATAARIWSEVTDGQGVVLVNGEEVVPS